MTDTSSNRDYLDYLAEIYRLSDDEFRHEGMVSTSALADLLMVTAPAVNRMVTKLKELGLLTHEPYKGIQLTKAGEREALLRIRNQRIAEIFLVKVMGFKWHEIHTEANNMSRALSESVAQRMLQMAQNPHFCPHGEPIPNPDGTIMDMGDIPLASAEAHKHYKITRVRTREADRLEYLAALGLIPQAEIGVVHVAPFDGPIQLKLGNEYRIVGHNLALRINVKEA
ncbi:MAG: metal-dependent transcriptional regulator [Anaerolineae bacterium]|jgi:DtxR family Mn-dependent transcriptional regulator|nr:metal-dependent transcriptional regulator [Anaerolineae bacterium]